MTYIFWNRFAALRAAPAADVQTSSQETEVVEFDEDGRRFVFRYPPFTPRSYSIDRDRIFTYMRTHRLPDYQARQWRRDTRNAANFYEDVREIQTHPDVTPVVAKAADSVESSVTELRMRRAV